MNTDIEALCRKLKPLIGERAERYWLAWQASSGDDRQELEVVLRMIAVKMLGSNVEVPQVHLSAPSSELAGGEYPLGHVVYCNRPLHPFGMREDEWIQHTAIFGRSGAGKTNTVFILIQNLIGQKKPFLIFDWKRNYRDMLAIQQDEILVYTVGREPVPFAFNPLIPPEGTDPSTWLKKLIEIIAHAYYLGEGVMFLLQEALHAVFQEFGVYQGKPKAYPTFNDVMQWLEQHPAKGRKALWMDSAMRGVKSICFGHMGEVINTAVQPNIAALLDKNVILELDGLTNADKNLIIESLLLWIHHWRMVQPERETFKHCILIEEAHHILLKHTGTTGGGEAVTDTILREIRELGEAIVLVDQHPSLISIPALGNTYTTIAMNVKHRSDVNALAGAMLMDEETREIFGRLPIGSAVVKLQGRWLEPFLIQIPHLKIPKGTVDDTALMQFMAVRNVLRINGAEPTNSKNSHDMAGQDSGGPVELSEREQHFLINIFERPLYGSVERYHGLGLSRRKGNILRESCVNRGLIAPVEILTRSGKTVLLELTPHGRHALRNLGHPVPDRHRWGSLEHEYWKQKVAQKIAAIGWTVKIEEPVNGYTDIIAEKNGETIAVEIETGKSDWQANLEKNIKKGLSKILIVATNPEGHEKISAAVHSRIIPANVQVEQAQEFL